MADKLVRDLPGSAYDPEEYRAGCLRADLATLIGNYALAQASRITEALLADYIVTPKRSRFKGA